MAALRVKFACTTARTLPLTCLDSVGTVRRTQKQGECMISRKILAVCAVLLMVGAFASMASASSLNGTQSFTKAEVAPLFIADPLTDLVLTPLNPCRIIDTRSGGGPIAANTQRTFSATTSSFTAQGG